MNADAIVVGLGAMGSATADELAGRGLSVIGIEAFEQGHINGSSHGATRFFRKVIEEAPFYVPLAVDALERWDDLQADTATELLVRNGVLRLGQPDGELVQAFRRSATAHDLPYEELSPAEVVARYDVLRVPDGFVGLLEADAGTLYADRTLATLQRRAQRRGAELRFAEPVTGWHADGDGVAVTTGSATYRADRLVITAGPWTSRVVADLDLPLVVHRIVNASFTPTDPDRCSVERLPALLLADGAARASTAALHGGTLYAVPAVPGEGFKAGTDGAPTDLGHVDRTVTDADVDALRRRLDRFLPGVVGPVASALTCLYTRTPDEHFVIDTHPEHRNVVVASPCSGHGFKYTPAIGAVLADLATGVPPGHDLTPFAISRFASRARWQNSRETGVSPPGSGNEARGPSQAR